MLQVLALSDYAATDLVEVENGRWCGRVERIDPLKGVSGWVIEVEAPTLPVELELVVGEDAFVLARSGEAHPEADRRLGFETRAAFHFPADLFARLARLAPRRRPSRVGVRIAGTETRLMPPGGCDPTVGELVDDWRDAVLRSLRPAAGEGTRGDRLLHRLAGLRTGALALRERVLRPISEGEAGQIDALHPGSDGQVWFVGWMKRGTEPDFPAIIVDREKLPAGGAVFHYERPDLNSTCVGVVGLLDTGWTPPPVLRDGFVYLGKGGELHLRYGPQTRLLRADAFLAAFTQAQAVAAGGHADALASVLNSGSNWIAGNAAATGLAAEGSLDHLLMVPGFGCFAEGWAVSPSKRIETFHMRIGDCVLVADEASAMFRPRPDLAPVFGLGATARASFTVAFQGALPDSAGGTPLLRIVHDDATSAVQRVEPKLLRRLDVVADGEELLKLFPSIRHEPFWEAFLRAQRRNLARGVREPAVLHSAIADRVVVLRLPGEGGNLNLAFDRLARHLGDLDPAIGICVVADQGRGRSEALLRFEELRAEAGARPMSLAAVAHAHDILPELPFLVARLGAERFVHVGRGLVLNARGWVEAERSLARRSHAIDRFEILDDAGRPDRVDGSLGAACFGWSASAFFAFAAEAPVMTRGLFGDNGLPVSPGRDGVVPGCAIRVERAPVSRLADFIDADLLAGRGREAA